jgi:hypothetical protein
MAKLPSELKAEEINDKTFRYLDAVELMADLRRFRRHLGWTLHWTGVDPEAKRFRFSFYGEEDGTCSFEILHAAIYQNLWPSLHPQNPEVPRLRRLFIDTKNGCHEIAAWVNETQPLPPEETGPTALDQLLLDDDE